VKLKISIILNSFPTITETFIVNQITDLIDKGHEVKIFAFHKNSTEGLHQDIIDYNLIEKTTYFHDTYVSKYSRYFLFFRFLILNKNQINFKLMSSLFNFSIHGRKALNLRNYTRFKWILDYAPFDIIHVHFGTNATYIAEMKTMGYFSSVGFVTSFHGYDISPHLLSKYLEFYKILFNEVNLVTVNTKYTQSLLNQITSFKKVEILPVGLNTRKFKKLGVKKDKHFTILFVGRLIELKGPHLAIEIFNALISRGYQDIRLKIVGEGNLRSQLQNTIRQYDLKEKVSLTGPLVQDQVIKHMETSDILILPGIYDKTGRAETQGLVIQEAQAMELPVIVSDVGGMKYGLLDGQTGFIVKERDIEGFADKIEILMINETLKIDMGRKGRQFVMENYDSKRLGMKLEKLYTEYIV
jgi:colanic acid/amylovoran biosynthesis glycosyltransferase